MMHKKLISLRTIKLFEHIDKINKSIDNIVPGPVRLNTSYLRKYIGSNIFSESEQSNTSFFFKKLSPQKDKHFIDSWKRDINNNQLWTKKWESFNKEFVGPLPRTSEIPEQTFGVISKINGKENLEGVVTFNVSLANGFPALSISHLELYFMNIGKDKAIPGIADMLMDIAVKFSCELTDSPLPLEMQPVTPGSLSQVKKRDYQKTGNNFLLNAQQAYQYYSDNNLDQLFAK